MVIVVHLVLFSFSGFFGCNFFIFNAFSGFFILYLFVHYIMPVADLLDINYNCSSSGSNINKAENTFLRLGYNVRQINGYGKPSEKYRKESLYI